MITLPTISENARLELKEIFDSQYKSFKSFSEHIKWNKKDKILTEQDLITNFSFDSINLIRNHDNVVVMHWFSFNIKNVLKIGKILNFSDEKFKNPKRYSAGRVLPHSNIPMHVDGNYTGGRENCIFSISLGGKDSQVYFSDRNDGSKKIYIAGTVDWIFYPSLMPHGSTTQNESLDLIQIDLSD